MGDRIKSESPTGSPRNAQANNVKALRGLEGMVRLRVGDWRVIMRDGVVVAMLDIMARGSAYKE